MFSANLLPQVAIAGYQRRRMLRTWSKLLGGCLLVTVILIVWGQTTADHLRRQVEVQWNAARPAQDARQRHAQCTQRLQELESIEHQQALRRSAYSPLVVIDLLHTLEQELGPQLQAESLEFHDAAGEDAVTAATPQRFVSLQLQVAGSTTCSELMQRLRDTGLFRDVSLSSPLELADPLRQRLRFSLRCEF